MAYVKFFHQADSRRTAEDRREAKDTGVTGEQMAARWLTDRLYHRGQELPLRTQ